MSNDFYDDEDFPLDGKPKSSPVLKILLVIGGVGMLVLCIACGVVMSTFTPQMTTTVPFEAAKVLSEIAPGVEPPQTLPPQQVATANIFYKFPMQTVMCAAKPFSEEPQPASMLIAIQFQGLIADNPQLRDGSLEMIKQLGPIDAGETVQKTEAGEVVVDDDILTVQVFTVKRSDGSIVKRAQLSLNASKGPTIILLQRPRDQFNIQELQRIVDGAEHLDVIEPFAEDE